jgi:transposase
VASPGDVAAQLQGHRQPAVRVAEERDVADPEHAGRLALLLLADAADLRARDLRVEPAGVAVGDDAVADLDPGRRPGGHAAAAAEVDVVRMRDHDEHPLHVLRRLHGW